MKKSLLLVSLLAAFAITACGKKEVAVEAPAAAPAPVAVEPAAAPAVVDAAKDGAAAVTDAAKDGAAAVTDAAKAAVKPAQ